MSTLLRLFRSQTNKNVLPFLKSRNIGVFNSIYRNKASSVPENKTEEAYEVKKDWNSYGFDYENKKLDRHFMHLTCFVSISLVLVFGAFLIAYQPDPLYKDWALREARLVLRDREENGLPLIDPNLVDPSKFTLPTEEELIDVEIII